MTKKELSQFIYLKKELKNNVEYLKELESKATNVSSFITGMPKSYRITDRVCDYSTQIADMKTMISNNTERCCDEINKINIYINSLDDSQLRNILFLRYIKGYSWQKIAFSTGYQDESVPRKRHNRFLKKY